MKWEKETLMENGTKIRIEDWSEDYSFINPFDKVVAYPICKKTSGIFVKEGESFRLELNFKNRKESEKAYEKIVSGEHTFKDYLKNIDPRYRDCV